MKNEVNRVANCQIMEPLTEKTDEVELFLVVSKKNGGKFHSFQERNK